MILHQQLSVLAQICRLSSILHKTKFRLHRTEKNPFRTFDDTGKIYIHSRLEFRWYVYLLTTIMSCAQYYVYKPLASLEETVLFWMSLASHLSFLCYNYVNETKTAEITLYLNSLYEFESLYKNVIPTYSEKSFQTKMGLLWVNCGIASLMVAPLFIVYGIHWINPCKISLLGFWMLDNCQPKKDHFVMIPKKLVKLLVFLGNHWMWAFGIYGTLLGVLVINTLTIICLYEIVGR